MSSGIPAVFLDRDGVLNRTVVRDGRLSPPASLAELDIPPDARGALAALRTAGFRLVVVTNQPDVARGTQTREVVEAINASLLATLPLDEIRVCYHDDPQECRCRKPSPGFFSPPPPSTASTSGRASWSAIAGRMSRRGDGRDVARFSSRPIRAAPTMVDIPTHRAFARGSLSVDPQPDSRRRSPAMTSPSQLRIKLFADGADRAGMLALYRNPLIKGFTTNPTLMRKAGVPTTRRSRSRSCEAIPDRPISFEVFSDDFAEMERQARKIAGWGENVYVKIPVTNTRGESSRGRSSGAGAGRREAERDGADDAAAGARRVRGPGWRAGRYRLRLRRPHRRHRPRPGAADGEPLSSCCVPIRTRAASGPARASCSTSSRPTRSAATSSPSPTTSSRS